jgi:putative pyruvate formate lyase activating enzyme
MPDMKYASQQIARAYSKIPHYPLSNQAAVKEMHRQVGDLQIDARGLAKRGLLVRHLVLPNNLAGTAEIVHFLAEEISPDTYLNLMDQYRPAFNVRQYPNQFPKLRRPVTSQEYQSALKLAREAGLHRFDK